MKRRPSSHPWSRSPAIVCLPGASSRVLISGVPLKGVGSGVAVSKLGLSALAAEFVSAETATHDSPEPQKTKAKATAPAAKISHFPSRMRRRINTFTSLRASKTITRGSPRLGRAAAAPCPLDMRAGRLIASRQAAQSEGEDLTLFRYNPFP